MWLMVRRGRGKWLAGAAVLALCGALWAMPRHPMLSAKIPYSLKSAVASLAFLYRRNPRPMLATKRPISLWSYAWALAAVEDVARLPGGRQYLPRVQILVARLQPYWDPYASPPAYAPFPQPGAAAIKYYDDNAWVGLDLLQAYRIFRNPGDLLRAEAIFRYEITGWDVRQGGIYWNDLHQTRNTPSNAPVAELAALLYRATHRQVYLRWAVRINAWEERTLVNPVSGEVWDRVNARGMVVRQDFTYDQGVVIGANALLYQITHVRQYLHNARLTSRFVYRYLRRHPRMVGKSAAFDGVLADNLRWYYRVDPSNRIPRMLQWLAAATDAPATLSQARASTTPIGVPLLHPIPILKQSGDVRILAIRAGFRR